MEKLLKQKKKKLTTAIIISVLLVIGIPMIVLGAVNKIWAVMAIGIAFTVAGFYGSPLTWVGYGNTVHKIKLVRTVTENYYYDVKEISRIMQTSYKTTIKEIDDCIKDGHMGRLKRDGEKIIYHEGEELKAAERNAICKFCGALVTFSGSSTRCPYCGALVAIELPKDNANEGGSKE